MPNFDGTGPAGKGSKTGRQMGKCEGTNPQGRPFDGRGQGMGRGRGGCARGLRGRFSGRNSNA